MRAFRLLCFLATLSVSLPALAGRSVQDNTANREPTPTAYHIEIKSLANQRLHVTVDADNPAGGDISFAIPAWTPGFYQILHFEKSIENVRAQDGAGRPLEVTHPSSRLWQAAAAGIGHVTLSYDVYAHDAGLGFFGSVLQAREHEGYVNGASALMYVVGRTADPTTLSVRLPSDWKLATGLAAQPAGNAHPAGTPDPAEQTFAAKNYDELIDCPLQFGKFDEVDFKTDGANFRCILVGSRQADKPQVAASLSQIAHAEIALFGSAPFDTYLFLYHIGGAGFYGGLEHRNSTVIHLADPLREGRDDAFLTVSAHEMFHAWNVKRLRPFGLGPFDYTRPVRTASLWWAEGITDYYAELLLVRIGLRDRDWFLREFGERIEMLDETPSRGRVTLEEASRKAWEGESEGYDGLSYYLKGSLVGLYFDLRLRELTEGRKSLDDVMRDLYARYAPQETGYPETALQKELTAVGGPTLTADYNRYVRGTDEIDWDKALPAAGLALTRERIPFLGVVLTTDDNASVDLQALHSGIAQVRQVEEGSAAQALGLHVGDQIVRVNGVRVTAVNFPDAVLALHPSAPLTLDVIRDGQRLPLTGAVGVRFVHAALLSLPDARLSAEARQVRDDFFTKS